MEEFIAAYRTTVHTQRTRDSSDRTAGAQPPMVKVRELIALVGRTDATVLIRGESGTGKELVARSLRAASLAARQGLRQGQLRGAAG